MNWLSPASNETMALIFFLLLLMSFQETFLFKQSLTSHGFFLMSLESFINFLHFISSYLYGFLLPPSFPHMLHIAF